MASTTLPTSLAMVVVGGGGEAGLDYVDAELGELPGYWGCNWGGGGGKVWVWEWSLMGFDGGEIGSGRRRYRVGVRESEVI